EQLWRRKQQEMASLLAQAGAQLVEAGRREVRQGRAANNGTRLASSNMGPRIACLRSDLDASRALAAWSRAAVQLRAERLGDERTSELQTHGEQMTLQVRLASGLRCRAVNLLFGARLRQVRQLVMGAWHLAVQSQSGLRRAEGLRTENTSLRSSLGTSKVAGFRGAFLASRRE
ncbi:unnamed protein product, partial [Polarella glacialis]